MSVARRNRRGKLRFPFYLGTQLLVGFDLCVNFFPVVIVVGKGVVYGRETQVRKGCLQFFGCQALMQDITNDYANGDPRAHNGGASAANARISGDVGMQTLGMSILPFGMLNSVSKNMESVKCGQSAWADAVPLPFQGFRKRYQDLRSNSFHCFQVS